MNFTSGVQNSNCCFKFNTRNSRFVSPQKMFLLEHVLHRTAKKVSCSCKFFVIHRFNIPTYNFIVLIKSTPMLSIVGIVHGGSNVCVLERLPKPKIKSLNVVTKFWQIGVPIRDSSSRQITNLCNLCQIVDKSQK